MRSPSDKSLTHRALLFAGMAASPSLISDPLMGEDCLATASCLTKLGVEVENSPDQITVIPPKSWSPPSEVLYCGNSGTTMRLFAGCLAGSSCEATLDGDASLRKRPMGRVAMPLRLMGARIEGDRAPLVIGGTPLTAIHYDSPIASAQVKSAILLAGLSAEGTTSVTEPSLSRDHTERMLAALGVPLQRDGLTVCVTGGKGFWDGFRFSVPGDISSAAFFAVAAVLVPGSDLRLTHVGLNPSRTGLLDVLQQVGASFELSDHGNELNEPYGTLTVRHTPDRKPFTIEGALVPRLIDEIPVLAVLATQCHGTSVIRDAAELRVKESDRIELVSQGLRAMGAVVEAHADGMVIHGPTPLHGATIDAQLDHRIAMAFAVASLIAEGETKLTGIDAVATSFPTFFNELARLQSHNRSDGSLPLS